MSKTTTINKEATAIMMFVKAQVKQYGAKSKKELTPEQLAELEKKVEAFKTNLKKSGSNEKPTATDKPTATNKKKSDSNPEKKTKKEKKEKAVEIKTGRTGTFTDAGKELATTLEAIFDPKHLLIHGDAKKNKLMIRVDNKLVTKIFIQKKGYKIHLKTVDDFKALQLKSVNLDEVFYQNGFNLAYAYKTDKATMEAICRKLAK